MFSYIRDVVTQPLQKKNLIFSNYFGKWMKLNTVTVDVGNKISRFSVITSAFDKGGKIKL